MSGLHIRPPLFGHKCRYQPVKQLITQASNNTKAQFSKSPTLSKEIMIAVIDALEAHNTMMKQAIDSEKVREGLKDVLLGAAQLYDAESQRRQDLDCA